MSGRYFFDVSSLKRHLRGAHTYSGIQRVVTNVAAAFAKVRGSENVYISYVDGQGRVMGVPFDLIGAETLVDAGLMRECIGAKGDSTLVRQALQRYLRKPHKFYFHRTRLDLMAMLGRQRAFRRIGMTPGEWIAARKRRTASGGMFASEAHEIQAGDILIAMDSSWDEEYGRAFIAARQRGCRVATLIHDLIPLTAAWSVDASMTLRFSRYIDDAMIYTDLFIANSQFTRRELTECFRMLDYQKEVAVLPLAQSVVKPHNEKNRLSSEMQGKNAGVLSAYPEAIEMFSVSSEARTAASVPYVLCVGTIEGRKNVWRLASSWKLLIEQGITQMPRLVFAGRPGIHSEPFTQMMEKTGNLYGYASVLREPTDPDIDFLYRNCEFIVMPSLHEGWGLPVGEALSYGKTGVVSSAGSLPEVGGEYVEYCNPKSIESISDAVKKLVLDVEYRNSLSARIDNSKLRSWMDVASELDILLRRLPDPS